MDVFDPNAPSSSLQIIQGFSLPNANNGDTASNHSNIFSSDEEDIELNDQDGSVQNDLDIGANESESIENRIRNDFPTDTSEQEIVKKISAPSPQPIVEQETSDMFQNPLPSTSGTIVKIISASSPQPSVEQEISNMIQNPLPSTSGTFAAAVADSRKVSPFKIDKSRLKPPPKKRKRKSKEIDENVEDGGIRPKKQKKAKTVTNVECKRCNQVVKQTAFIKHFSSHIGEPATKPVGNKIDKNYDCPHCQFSSKKHMVSSHIYEKHCLPELLEKGSMWFGKKVTSIEQLYGPHIPFHRPPTPPPQ